MGSDEDRYAPVRPPLHARWTEWSAAFHPCPQTPDAAPDEAARRSAATAGPVLVMPGLARSDRQTAQLRAHLIGLGFDARGWGLGIDIGPTRRVLDGLDALLVKTTATDGPVALIGLSMGGLFARWLAQRHPASVRQVITVCSPFRAPLESFFLPLRQIAPLWPGDVAGFVDAVGRRLTQPTTSLYTVTDGTVAWRSCFDPDSPADSFAFVGPHLTMATNPGVWRLLGQRLARPPS